MGDETTARMPIRELRRSKPLAMLGRWIARAMLVGLALGVSGFLACQGSHKLDFTAEKPISRQIPAQETRLLDLRFQTGSLRILRSSEPQIRVEGKVYVKTTDQATAKLKADQLDLEVSQGRFTILTVAENATDSAYEVDLDVTVPEGVDLRLVLGSGQVEINSDLPNRTDVQVGSGEVAIHLPPACSTQVNAKTNMGDVTVTGFETKTGEVHRQLMYSEFDGAIGTEWLGGKKLDVSVNTGSIVIEADRGNSPGA